MASSDPVWLQILTLLIMNCVALTDDLASLCLSFSIYKMRLINLVLHSFIHSVIIIIFYLTNTFCVSVLGSGPERS